ncbi:Abi family protein [Staphylococcus saprophyticus]|nr:Abi family protein [Staphylococcus saprophyticus]
MEKEYTTLRNRLDKLRDRGMIIPTNKSKERNVVKKYNYYNLINGYKEPFLEARGNYPPHANVKEDYFIVGTSPSHLEALMKFDERIRNIFLQRILKIEEKLKDVIVQSFYEYHTNNGKKKSVLHVLHRESEYLKRAYYNLNEKKTFQILEKSQYRYTVFSNVKSDSTMKNKPKTYIIKKSETYDKLIARIYGDIGRQRRKSKYISSYLDKHTYLPMWVLTNILTFGQISKLYDIQKEDIQNKIISKLKLEESNVDIDISVVNLSRVMNILAIFRNLCAHNERMYCEKISIPIDDDFMKYLDKFPYAQEVNNKKGTNRHLVNTKAHKLKEYREGLYTLMFCVSLFLNERELKSFKSEIRSELKELKIKLSSFESAKNKYTNKPYENILKLMGLNFDWYSLLKK